MTWFGWRLAVVLCSHRRQTDGHSSCSRYNASQVGWHHCCRSESLNCPPLFHQRDWLTLRCSLGHLTKVQYKVINILVIVLSNQTLFVTCTEYNKCRPYLGFMKILDLVNKVNQQIYRSVINNYIPIVKIHIDRCGCCIVKCFLIYHNFSSLQVWGKR